MLIFPSQRNYSLSSGFSVERLRQVLLSYDIAGKFWDLTVNIRFTEQGDFGFPPLKYQPSPPFSQIPREQVYVIGRISDAPVGNSNSSFSCYYSRYNVVSPKCYSQIFKERENRMHRKEVVLAIVFLICFSVLIFNVKLRRHFVDAGHDFSHRQSLFLVSLQSFSVCPARMVKLCSTIDNIQEHLMQID